jgi:hypothetical protein
MVDVSPNTPQSAAGAASEVAAKAAEDGEAPAETKAQCKLIDLIVETVSKCSDETDDGVQLQVSSPSTGRRLQLQRTFLTQPTPMLVCR